MNAKWLICNLGKDDHIQQLYYGVIESGREAEVVSLKDFAEIVEKHDDERACKITVGSIWLMGEVRKTRPNWVGCWHDESLYDCKRYYAHWGQYITQQKYVMMPFSELMRQKDWVYDTLAIDDQVFFRPDSGGKEFTGAAIGRAAFDSWAKHVVGVEHGLNRIPCDLLCIAAEPRKLHKEIRLVISDGKVVTGSMYRMAMHSYMQRWEGSGDSDEARVIEFAEEVLAKNLMKLPPVHVLDIAVEEDRLSVLEVGCFCCAGLYCCDRRKIGTAVSLVAEDAFQKPV